MSAKLISLIGPPASGKTTLAIALKNRLSATLIREDYAGNPFLAESYVGNESAKLPGQLYFIMSRVSQLWAPSWPEKGLYVSDYGFCQDRIYARARLNETDYAVYEKVAGAMERLVHPPDILISLDAPPDTLMERIAARGRKYEKAMNAAFLHEMREEYRRIVENPSCETIQIDTKEHDLRRESVLEGLIAEVQAKL